MRRLLVAVLVFALAGCGATRAPVADGGLPGDAGSAPDAGPVDKAAQCASSFGDALTAAFGRLDGTVLAVVPPSHPTCALPNDDHVVVQMLVGGTAYRMVVNVRSSFGPDYRVRYAEMDTALTGGAWSEGWHPGASLDYASTLGVHTAAFTPYEMPELVTRVTEAITVGEPISVFAHSSGGSFSHSAHKIHRNGGGADGAIVVRPTSAEARWLLFQFADQSF